MPSRGPQRHQTIYTTGPDRGPLQDPCTQAHERQATLLIMDVLNHQDRQETFKDGWLSILINFDLFHLQINKFHLREICLFLRAFTHWIVHRVKKITHFHMPFPFPLFCNTCRLLFPSLLAHCFSVESNSKTYHRSVGSKHAFFGNNLEHFNCFILHITMLQTAVQIYTYL